MALRLKKKVLDSLQQPLVAQATDEVFDVTRHVSVHVHLEFISKQLWKLVEGMPFLQSSQEE